MVKRKHYSRSSLSKTEVPPLKQRLLSFVYSPSRSLTLSPSTFFDISLTEVKPLRYRYLISIQTGQESFTLKISPFIRANPQQGVHNRLSFSEEGSGKAGTFTSSFNVYSEAGNRYKMFNLIYYSYAIR